jgi:hypothetical protein
VHVFSSFGRRACRKAEAWADFEIEYHEAQGIAVEIIMRDFIKPFLLKEAPLF